LQTTKQVLRPNDHHTQTRASTNAHTYDACGCVRGPRRRRRRRMLVEKAVRAVVGVRHDGDIAATFRLALLLGDAIEPTVMPVLNLGGVAVGVSAVVIVRCRCCCCCSSCCRSR
jgi:hypothetical protein